MGRNKSQNRCEFHLSRGGERMKEKKNLTTHEENLTPHATKTLPRKPWTIEFESCRMPHMSLKSGSMNSYITYHPKTIMVVTPA